MPIKRIEKQLMEQGVLGNFPRFGKLRKGAEKGEKSAGRDLDYFRLTLEPQYEHIRPQFVELYGEQPTEFRNVFLAADSAELAFQYHYEAWAHARLLRRCDGETISVAYSDGMQTYDNTPHDCTCNPVKPDCKIHGRLDVVLPELFELTGAWGKFTIETHSVYDAVALRSAMIVAGAFAANIPNTAFWSIPFRVGRAMRPVPVTINGKRSVKPMSLLFAEVEPEFNQKVVQPRLTAPTQKLLAGVNPETGEMPDIVVDQPESWDREYVNAETLHLFDHENHQANAIDQMISSGLLQDSMNDDTVIGLIIEARQQREAEKQAEVAAKNAPKSNKKGSKPSAAQPPVQSDPNWSKNAPTVVKFIAQAQAKLNLNHGQVLDALKWVSPAPIQNVEDFEGTREEAWAACIAFNCSYNSDAVMKMIPDESNAVRVLALDMIEKSNIPF